MKIFIVYYVTEDNYGIDKRSIEKAFTTIENAEKHKKYLQDKYKNDIKFKHGFWSYEIDILEIH